VIKLVLLPDLFVSETAVYIAVISTLSVKNLRNTNSMTKWPSLLALAFHVLMQY